MYEACNPTQMYTLPFAAWELRLYLDTHPSDACALATYRELCAKAGKDTYATLPAYETDGGYHWVDDKWPWEYGASCSCDGNGR